jgi:ribosomal protein L24
MRARLALEENPSLGVGTTSQTFTFRNEFYAADRYGRLFDLHLDKYFAFQVIPTVEEVEEFRGCSQIPFSTFDAIMNRASNSQFQPEDRVRIISGNFQNDVGTILNVRDSEADVEVQKLIVTIPLHFLRKTFSIGDEVQVHSGSHKGVNGWIVGMSPIGLSVYELKSNSVGFFLLWRCSSSFIIPSDLRCLLHGCPILQPDGFLRKRPSSSGIYGTFQGRILPLHWLASRRYWPEHIQGILGNHQVYLK